ncbi:ATP-binding cassette domain-containing protein [Myxococcota bacterium]|nr:ATP-binding cassette domain-containing protein [Myxococcota bacterium]
MFSLRGISKAYDGVSAIDGCDLDVTPQRTTVLIGPSGCGKSTLLRLMIGLTSPDAGEVHFGKTPMTLDSAPGLRQRMGYVIQDGGLFPHLTAEANVTLMATYLGWETERVRSRVHELANLTQLPETALGRYPVELSGGQRQRVSLMRALMLDPDVLLLDEPLGALDPMIRFDLQSDLREIFETLKKTVVMVTHDMAEAVFFGDAIVLLRDGRIVQAGSFDQLRHAPEDEFVTRFLRAQRLPEVNPA